MLSVTLYEENHIYKSSSGLIYDSVSSIIGMYKQPFDAISVSINYAAKHGNTPEYWREKWAATSSFACLKGSAFHLFKENITRSKETIIYEGVELPVQNWYKLREENPNMTYDQLPAGVYFELTLCNHNLLIAGTSDIVVIMPDKRVFFDDYKTNKEFKTESFYNKRTGQYKMMQFPADSLMDCHKGHYTLQLNIYAWMLKQYGFHPCRLRIEYYKLPEEYTQKLLEGKNIPDFKGVEYIMDYLPELTEDILRHYIYYRSVS